ncbi:DUF3293 domain-containing protein [Sulfurimonas sp.]|jgi:hypothetical protein|uniref:DUF3293 domain-containing protein n=1 Tax=Sulfurimonas sp. TaxID=2022749 RepID=UPI0025EF1DDB|nr:DUF3293 domain-containing protein [Sulfurimonas sp.]MBT5934983.1 DUF3293 domain-containing protein [Sulfurimonas sp.]
MPTYSSDNSLQNKEEYQEVLLVNGYAAVIEDKHNQYNQVARARKEARGYFYCTDDKNLYMNHHMTNNGGFGYAPICLIDYSSYENDLKFKSAVHNEDWKTIYKYTKFLINNGVNKVWFSFQFIPKEENYLSRAFAIISAENPNMQIQSENENATSSLSMINYLQEKNLEFYDSMGELSGHEEKSFIIYDIDKKSAISLGKKFQQESILFNDREFISILNCNSRKIELELDHNKYYSRKTRLDSKEVVSNC